MASIIREVQLALNHLQPDVTRLRVKTHSKHAKVLQVGVRRPVYNEMPVPIALLQCSEPEKTDGPPHVHNLTLVCIRKRPGIDAEIPSDAGEHLNMVSDGIANWHVFLERKTPPSATEPAQPSGGAKDGSRARAGAVGRDPSPR